MKSGGFSKMVMFLLLLTLVVIGVTVLKDKNVFLSRTVPFSSGHTQLAQVASSQSCTAVCSGLVGYWPFDDGSGTTAADASGNGNTGTLTPLSGLPAWTTGAVGGALTFNASNEVTTTLAENIPGNLSISLWIQSSSAGGLPIVFGAGNNTYILADGVHGTGFTVNGAFYNGAHVSTNLLDGKWHHIVGTFSVSGNLCTLYIDGVQVATASDTWTSHSGNDLAIGDPFTGSIDDVRLYNSVLSAGDVSALYALGSNAGNASNSSNSSKSGNTESSLSAASPPQVPASSAPVQPVQTVTSGPNFYLGQASLGVGDGSNCTNTLPTSWFNNPSNWGSGQGHIGPGDTVYLCGTIIAPAGASAFLQFQGGGTAGDPVTLAFAPGAILQAPYWGVYGAISCKEFNYVTLDGGTNGILEATANGTGLQYQQDGNGIVFNSCNNFEIKNLTVQNIYVHQADDTAGGGANPFDIAGGNNSSIHNNIVHDGHWCIAWGVPSGTTGSNYSIYDNTIYNCDHGIAQGDGNVNTFLNGLSIYGNTIYGFSNWDTTQDLYHHDGIHVWSTHVGSETTGVQIYNNFIYGDPGGNMSAYIYIEAAGTPNGEGTIPGSDVFNNVLYDPSATDYSGDGMLYDYASNSNIYNNTIVSDAQTTCYLYYGVTDGRTGATLENNICVGQGGNNSNGFGTAYGGTFKLSNYNDFYGVASPASLTGKYYLTLKAWQAGPGNQDGSSIFASPMLSGNYTLQSGSPAISAGANLSSLCGSIPALCRDKTGNPRPSSGLWDMGAYQYCTGSCPQAPAAPVVVPKITPVAIPVVTPTPVVTPAVTPVITPIPVVTPTPVPSASTTVAVFSLVPISSAYLSLAPGTRSPAVMSLQNALIAYAYLAKGLNTGYYGTLTKAAVVKYEAATKTTSVPAVSAAPAGVLSPSFTRTLSLGMTGSDVKNLQIFLNDHGFIIAPSGNGSPSHETSYFGPATKVALIRFQNVYAAEILKPYGLNKGTGVFGPATMKEVDSML